MERDPEVMEAAYQEFMSQDLMVRLEPDAEPVALKRAVVEMMLRKPSGSFSIVSDPSPNGRAWVELVMLHRD